METKLKPFDIQQSALQLPMTPLYKIAPILQNQLDCTRDDYTHIQLWAQILPNLHFTTWANGDYVKAFAFGHLQH